MKQSAVFVWQRPKVMHLQGWKTVFLERDGYWGLEERGEPAESTDAGGSAGCLSQALLIPQFSQERGEGTNRSASNCTQVVKSARHACLQPKALGSLWSNSQATWRISLYFQALQERFISQAIEMLQSVALHGHFFFSIKNEERRNRFT